MIVINYLSNYQIFDNGLEEKMKKAFIQLFLLCSFLLFTACDSSTEPKYEDSYFPLKEGNIWYYSGYLHSPDKASGEKESKWEVTGKKTFGGLSYFEVSETNLTRTDIPVYKNYYYLDGDKLYKYDEDRKKQSLFASFNLAKEQSFQYFDYVVTVTEKTDSTITFFYDHPSIVDEEHWFTFEKGSGVKTIFSVWGIGSLMIEKDLK